MNTLLPTVRLKHGSIQPQLISPIDKHANECIPLDLLDNALGCGRPDLASAPPGGRSFFGCDLGIPVDAVVVVVVVDDVIVEGDGDAIDA